MALIFKIEIKEIYIYPLGAISKFNMPLNINPIKEFIILIMGPIFQILAYFILVKLFPVYESIIRIYNIGILGFNLLPIYPLDGGKLLKLFLDKYISYKNSFNIIIYISYLVVLIIVLINRNININLIIITIFLLFLVSKEKRRINCYYQKFILERYLNNYNFKNSKIINSKDRFYRNKKHIIKIDDNYYLEKEYLNKLYKK